MRILHTSDWHLGRSFHRVGMLDAQAAYVDHLLAVGRGGAGRPRGASPATSTTGRSRRSTPWSWPTTRSPGWPPRGRRSWCPAATTTPRAGSGSTRGSPTRPGVHLRTRWQDVGAPVLLEDAHGPVAVYGIPYLEPDAVRTAWDLPARSHEAALTAAMPPGAAPTSPAAPARGRW